MALPLTAVPLNGWFYFFQKEMCPIEILIYLQLKKAATSQSRGKLSAILKNRINK